MRVVTPAHRVREAVLILPCDWDSSQQDRRQVSLTKRDVSLFGGCNSLKAVLQRRQDFQLPVQHLHLGDKLMYGHPLGLAYRLLDVAFLPFGSIGGKDCELM